MPSAALCNETATEMLRKLLASPLMHKNGSEVSLSIFTFAMS